MGFSLEAVLVVPLCLMTVTSSVIMAETLTESARNQAIAACTASQIQADARHLYRLKPVQIDSSQQRVLTLESSPQKALVLCRLVEDQIAWTKRWLISAEERPAP